MKTILFFLNIFELIKKCMQFFIFKKKYIYMQTLMFNKNMYLKIVVEGGNRTIGRSVDQLWQGKEVKVKHVKGPAKRLKSRLHWNKEATWCMLYYWQIRTVKSFDIILILFQMFNWITCMHYLWPIPFSFIRNKVSCHF